MADSLQLNGIELIGGTYYNLVASPELGAPVPDTSTIAGVLLDGDRVTGKRSGNRVASLPIEVKGASRVEVAARVNDLITVVDSESFTLQWTPDGGYAVAYDGLRGTFERARIDFVEQAFVTFVTLTFPALPFGRSTVAQTITAAASPTQIDALDSAATNGALDTINKYQGTGSNSFTATRATSGSQYRYTTPVVSRAISSLDLSACGTASVRVRFTSTGTLATWPLVAKLTLTSAAGGTSTYTKTVTVAESATVWTLFTFDLTNPSSDFTNTVNLAAVTGWQLSYATTYMTPGGTPSATKTDNFDDLRAYPASSTQVSTASSAVLLAGGVKGTTRTPVNLTVTRGGSSFTDLLVHSPPADQDPDLTIVGTWSAASVAIPAANAKYNGTYTVVMLISAAGTGTRTVTVTATQKIGATTIGLAQTAVTYGSSGKLLVCGEITLPPTWVPTDNTTDTLTLSYVTSGGTADTFTDVCLLDTRGQSVLVYNAAATTKAAYVDEPTPAASIGHVFTSITDRTGAYSVLDSTISSGGPVVFEPGLNKLLVASPSGTPQVAATFFPRWLDERDVA